MIVGGRFSQAGSTFVNHIARWDDWSWSNLDTGLDSSVNAMLQYGKDLIVCGNFDRIGGVDVAGMARWDGSAWYPFGFFPYSGADCIDLVVHDGMLVATGAGTYSWNQHEWFKLNDWGAFALASYEGDLIAAMDSRLERWNGTSWEELDTGMDGIARTFVEYQGKLLIGGAFSRAGNWKTRALATWDGTSYGAVGGGLGVGISEWNEWDAVYDIFVHEGDIVVGGEFTFAGTALTQGVARLRNESWSALSLATPVHCFGSYNEALIAGGGFSEFSNIASLNGGYWSNVRYGFDAPVFSVINHNGMLVAGGSFLNSGLTALNHIGYKWTTSSWLPFGNGTNGNVYSLASWDDSLVIAGKFTKVDGVTVKNIARWTGEQWQSIGAGIDGYVNVILVDDETLIVAGGREIAEYNHVGFVSKWDGSIWQTLGSTFSNPVNAIAKHNGQLIVGGSRPWSNPPPNRLKRWTGVMWEDVGGDLDGNIYCLKSHNGVLYVGGAFQKAGGQYSTNLAQWGRLGIIGDWNRNAILELSDFGFWANCHAGIDGDLIHLAPSLDCLNTFNTDSDEDVDLKDYAEMQNVFMDPQ